MLTALLVDDEAQGRAALRGKLELFCPEVSPIHEASTVEEALTAVLAHRPQLLFLDIHLGDRLGFELLELLAAEENPWNGEVIFVTAHDEFAVRAIRFSALDYLLKPIDPEELVSAIRRAEERKGFAPGLPVLMDHLRGHSDAGKKIVVPCCESTSNYTQFFMKSGKKLLASKTLKEYDLLLSDYGFERIHKSHLVNMEFVKRYVPSDGGYVILEDDSTVPVANRKKDVLVARLRAL